MDSQTLTNQIIANSIVLKQFFDNLNAGTVTDERILAWLDTAVGLLHRVQSGEPVDLGPDRSLPENLLMKYKIDVRSILRKAQWLAPTTREKLSIFVDYPPPVIQRDKYRLSYDSFTARIPQWMIDLKSFVDQPGLQFLEIGSFEGFSACWMLDNILTQPSSFLTCVDLFQKSKDNFEYNISQTEASERVIRLQGLSSDVLTTLTPNFYDFIYVDASHDQVQTLENAVLGWRLLKRHGVMTFDDYLLKDSVLSQLFRPERPDIGIDAFLRVFVGYYETLYSGYHVTVRKL